MDGMISAYTVLCVSLQAQSCHNAGLALNLAVLDDKEPEIEGQDKRRKLAFFERHMSEVYPGIFVVGEHLAKDRQALDAAGVTHIINCIGMVMKPQFPDSYKYLTLHLLGRMSWLNSILFQ